MSSSFVVSYASVQSGKILHDRRDVICRKFSTRPKYRQEGPRGFSTLLRNSPGQSDKSHDGLRASHGGCRDPISFHLFARFFSFPFLSPCIFPCAISTSFPPPVPSPPANILPIYFTTSRDDCFFFPADQPSLSRIGRERARR